MSDEPRKFDNSRLAIFEQMGKSDSSKSKPKETTNTTTSEKKGFNPERMAFLQKLQQKELDSRNGSKNGSKNTSRNTSRTASRNGSDDENDEQNNNNNNNETFGKHSNNMESKQQNSHYHTLSHGAVTATLASQVIGNKSNASDSELEPSYKQTVPSQPPSSMLKSVPKPRKSDSNISKSGNANVTFPMKPGGAGRTKKVHSAFAAGLNINLAALRPGARYGMFSCVFFLPFFLFHFCFRLFLCFVFCYCFFVFHFGNQNKRKNK